MLLSIKEHLGNKKEKIFDDESDAKWFERAMKRTNFITKLTEVNE